MMISCAQNWHCFSKCTGMRQKRSRTTNMQWKRSVVQGPNPASGPLLPEADGKYICKEIRKRSPIPILIITSQNTEMNELLCLNYGADDFIAKPFNPQILLAHVEAVLKRSQGALQESEEISCGDFILDISRGVAKAGEKEADLTKNESRILYCLAKNKGKIVSRDVMINDLWDSELFVDDNTLTVNITRLRAKLESIGQKGVIHTKRGQGYLLE